MKYIIRLNNHRNNWNVYVAKTNIKSFNGFCFLIAQRPSNKMLLTKKDVHDCICLYKDEPHTQHLIRKGIHIRK